MQIADRCCGLASDSLSAVEIHRAARRDPAGQGEDALRKLLPKLDLFLLHREPQEVYAGRPPKCLDIVDGLGVRSDEESGKGLGVIRARESRFYGIIYFTDPWVCERIVSYRRQAHEPKRHRQEL